jgi:Putative peptidoglycan binding domain
MLKTGPLTLDQVLENCATIRPDGRRRCLNTVLRDTGVQPIGCKRASAMVPLTVDLQTTGIPPAGAVVLWTGGGNGDGHITVSAGAGDCWTVDWVDGLHQSKVAISAINRSWTSLRYAGWATNYGGRFALDVAGGANELPTLKLSRFVDSMSEMDRPRSVKQHPLTVATAEHALRKLGFRPGPIDGHYGTGTDQAVKAFQASLDDPMDGRLGPKQWARLAVRSGLFVAAA